MSAKSDYKSDVVAKLPIGSLRDFSCHPYKARDDESMRETEESVKAFGVLVPIIVRPCEAGGYEIISGRSESEQLLLLDAMGSEQATPSLSQVQRLKQFSQRGELTSEVMRAIMSEEKKEAERITLKGDTLRKYFPRSYTPKQMEETIIRLLEQWQKRRTREVER